MDPQRNGVAQPLIAIFNYNA